MTIQQDFRELLRLLEENEVDYLIIGGYAVAFHGYPRFTKDLDIFFRNSPENIDRLRKALLGFGFSSKELPENVFSERGNILVFGVPPTRIDLLNEIDGISFDEAFRNSIKGTYDNLKARFIGYDELLLNKKASPRISDKADVEELERIHSTD
ncbi:MAG: hypothetical protein GF388_06965 [Candidatus Aegiribacteria sp.]|nr:hypothetical protein [Candidatus Aegiribacteria sp.]